MLFLVFKLGNERYALQARNVVEVLPLLSLKRLPHPPKGVVGLIDYHGRPVPALDVSGLTLGKPACERLSTRVILVACSFHGQSRLLGLIAEHVTELVRKNEAEFESTAVSLRTAPFLGPVMLDENGTVQLLLEQHLLPSAVQEQLFDKSLGLPSELRQSVHP